MAAVTRTDERTQPIPEILALADTLAAEILAGAAAGSALAHDAPDDISQRLLLAARDGVQALCATVAGRLHEAAAALSDALRSAQASVGAPNLGADLPQPAGMPPFDAVAALGRIVVPKPGPRFLGAPLRVWHLRRRLRDQKQNLARALVPYLRQLEAWREQALGSLRQAYTAQADLVLAHMPPAAVDRADAVDAERMRADLERLRQFGESEAAPRPPLREQAGMA